MHVVEPGRLRLIRFHVDAREENNLDRTSVVENRKARAIYVIHSARQEETDLVSCSRTKPGANLITFSSPVHELEAAVLGHGFNPSGPHPPSLEESAGLNAGVRNHYAPELGGQFFSMKTICPGSCRLQRRFPRLRARLPRSNRQEGQTSSLARKRFLGPPTRVPYRATWPSPADGAIEWQERQIPAKNQGPNPIL
jgi:hypothetical protein